MTFERLNHFKCEETHDFPCVARILEQFLAQDVTSLVVTDKSVVTSGNCKEQHFCTSTIEQIKHG